VIRTFYAMAFAACVGIAANAASAECFYGCSHEELQRQYEEQRQELERLQECRPNGSMQRLGC